MDRSILISWYNLPAAARAAYLPWMHGGFIDRLTQRPGVLWAAHYEVKKYDIPARVRATTDQSVPTGNDYILMLGAASSHAFARPLDSFAAGSGAAPDSDLNAEDRKMLALRCDERISLFTEEARVDGPEIKTRPDRKSTRLNSSHT